MSEKRRGRGLKKRTMDDNIHDGESSGPKGRSNGTVDNVTLELLLQRMDEFKQKLESMSSHGSNEGGVGTNSTSSREIIGETSDLGPRANTQETSSYIAEDISTMSSIARNIFVVQPTISKPIFDGKSQINPITFLKRLKKYIKSINAHDREVDIALECVTGHVRKVMEVYSKGWAKFADFEADFRRNYWTEQIQEAVRYKLIRGAYSRDSGITMSEHFAEQIESMQSLTIAFSERDLVNSIMRHYSVDIQQLWFTRTGEPTIINGANFLRGLEQNIVLRQQVTPVSHLVRNNRRDRHDKQPITATVMAEARRGQ